MAHCCQCCAGALYSFRANTFVAMHGPVSGRHKWNDGNRMQGELPSLQGEQHLSKTKLYAIDIRSPQ